MFRLLFTIKMLKDKRLNTVFEMVPECGICADIGTDHGKLGCALLQAEKCETVWFSDLSSDSLQKARELAGRKGFTQRAAFFVGDGAACLPGSPDCAVIAGMGGQTICHILKEGIQKLADTILVLGANVGEGDLRRFLMENRFRIDEERAVEEGGRHYALMRVSAGEMNLSEEEILAGPILLRSRDAQTRSYAAARLTAAQAALNGALRSETADKEKLMFEVETWRKLI